MTFAAIRQQAEADEYEICMRRGHKPGPSAIQQGNLTWNRCVWCGTDFAIQTTTQVVERNTPSERTRQS